MKRIISIFVIFVMCMILSGCASLQATMSEYMEEMVGIDNYSYEEYEAMYKAEWDDFFGALGEFFGMAADEVEEVVQEKVENIGDDIKEEIEDLFTEEELIDWESITDADKVTFANIKDENGYTEPYNNRFSKGQCTWYAYGRFCEDNCIDKIDVRGDAKTWLDNCTDENVRVERNPANIVPNSIAVDYKTTDASHPGHVTYIENVTYDENGNPVDVYFTECNWDSNGEYNDGTDGIVKKLPYSEFVNRGSHKVIGYLIPED